ncbi:MAG: lysophospholipid acyltransferase family protein [Pseudonocardia sp.]
MPSSPCGLHCLPPSPTGAPPVLRLAALAGLVLLALLGMSLLPGGPRGRWLRACCGGALRVAGVRLVVAGAERFRDGGVLVVANHLSWIDVLALTAVQPVRILAKREVRTWPVIGPLAALTGALFLDRTELRSLPATVATTADALRSGAAVAVFPEGTTWCGAAGGPFRRAAFQAAIDAGVPVRPVALTLRRPDGRAAPAAAFVGDQELVDSVCRVLRSPGLVCELTILPELAPGVDRRELARRSADAIGDVTTVVHAARPVTAVDAASARPVIPVHAASARPVTPVDATRAA